MATRQSWPARRRAARAERTAPEPRSHGRAIAAAALGAVFLVKLVVLLQLKNHPLLQADAGLDTTAYVDLAKRVVGGNIALGPGLYYMSPLYIYFLAAVLAVSGALTAARLVQIVLGTAAVAFVFVAADAWFGRRAAWCAAALAALAGPLTFYEVTILQTSLDGVLTAGALAALAVALVRQRPRWAVAAGACLGLQMLNRPNVALAAAALVVGLFVVRRLRLALLVAAGIAGALAPVTLRNVVVAHQWSITSSQGGLNFYIGNSGQATGTYEAVPGVTPNIAGQAAETRRVAEQATGHPLSDAQVSNYFFGLGLGWMAAHPGAAARLFLHKVNAVFNAQAAYLNVSYPFYEHDAGTILPVLFAGPWLLVPIGLVGLAWPLATRSAFAGAPEPTGGARRADYLVWASFVPAYALSVALFFVADRYRLPLLIPLCVGGGAFLDWVAATVLAHRMPRLAVPVAVVVVLGVWANWPLHLEDGRAEDRMRMAERLIASGDSAQAETWIARAEAINPKPGVVEYRAGNSFLQAGQVQAAERHLSRANQLDPGRPQVELSLGRALVGVGRASEAVSLMRQAIAGGLDANAYGYDLAQALTASGDRAGAVEVLRKTTPTSTDVRIWMQLGRLAAEDGAPDVAERFFRQGVALQPMFAPAHEQLGVALMTLGRFDEAGHELTAAVGLDPHVASSFSALAYCELKLGRPADARLHLQQALRLDPNDELAQRLVPMLR
jgi:Flp pilus assembly protein TadD/4-amino-4-deoxy-L-arabinose transferase-like glycosyltransferase